MPPTAAAAPVFFFFFVLFFFDDAPVPACVARGLARFRFRPAAVPAALLALPVSIGSGVTPVPRRDSNQLLSSRVQG